MRKYYKQLPPLNQSTWKYLLELLVKVKEREAQNLMSASNLAIVFGPNVLWKENGTMEDSTLEARVVSALLKFFILNKDEILKP